ncbi:MAG: GAF domain-containing protein [Janthinobacterium lividum]
MTTLTSPYSYRDAKRRRCELALQVDHAPVSLAYEDIVLLAANICGTPMALITVLDCNHQHILACVGMTRQQTRRENAFCTHALLKPDTVMVVPDARLDERFKHNPHVFGAPYLRFYAGAPIITKDGFPIGTVCVVDLVPRKLQASELIALQALARATASLMEANETVQKLDKPKDFDTLSPAFP